MFLSWASTYISFALIGFSSYKAVGSKNRFFWVRVALSEMLLLSGSSVFLPDENNTTTWQINPDKHVLLLFLLGLIVTNIIFFLFSSRKSYLVGMCLFYFNVFFFNGALLVFNFRATVTILVSFIYFIGLFVPLLYAANLNPEVLEGSKAETELIPIYRSYKSTFGHSAFYLASLCIGVTLLLVSVVSYISKTGDLFINSLLLGIAFTLPSIISLVPKKQVKLQ